MNNSNSIGHLAPTLALFGIGFKQDFGNGGQCGKQIGRYQIKNKLGQGGLGAVYLAHDPNLRRDVALKVISPYLLWHQLEQKALRRFRRGGGVGFWRGKTSEVSENL